MLLEAAQAGFGGLSAECIADSWRVIVDRSDGDWRNMIVATPGGHHRLLLKSDFPGQELGFSVVADTWAELRAAALSWFLQTASVARAKVPYCLSPTPFQRHRLVLMLRILDCLAEATGSAAPTRLVAQRLTYPQTKFANALEWKVSSERRQTRRLIEEAEYLMEAGYRDLLKGQLKVR